MTLKLNSNWRFTLEGPELSKSGDYFPEGGGITLDFVRDDDGMATATPGENKIVLVMKEATMTFREEVDFTVSFESNGGTSVNSDSVLNGKTVEMPSAPVREGFTFDGWYTDKDLKKPFNFSTIITENTVLYAKWTENK